MGGTSPSEGTPVAELQPAVEAGSAVDRFVEQLPSEMVLRSSSESVVVTGGLKRIVRKSPTIRLEPVYQSDRPEAQEANERRTRMGSVAIKARDAALADLLSPRR